MLKVLGHQGRSPGRADSKQHKTEQSDLQHLHLGETIWALGSFPQCQLLEFKGCTGHSKRPRLCGPRANYRDNYSSPRLGCRIRLCGNIRLHPDTPLRPSCAEHEWSTQANKNSATNQVKRIRKLKTSRRPAGRNAPANMLAVAFQLTPTAPRSDKGTRN